jgi:FkbM family methyltransferase
VSAIKKFGDWWLPAHEKHLQPWMEHPKNRNVVLNGRVAYQGRKQQAALDLVRLVRAGQPLRTAVDVGAHCGLWSFNLAHWFDHVHAFEPMAVHRDCFNANLQDLESVTLHPCALGAQQGMVRLESEPGSSGNTKIVGDGDIELRTLDSFELHDVDLIKLDCEGYELHALRGAIDTIARFKPVIVVEQKRDMAEQMGLPKLGAVAFLVDQGYRLAREISGDYYLVPA